MTLISVNNIITCTGELEVSRQLCKCTIAVTTSIFGCIYFSSTTLFSIFCIPKEPYKCIAFYFIYFTLVARWIMMQIGNKSCGYEMLFTFYSIDYVQTVSNLGCLEFSVQSCIRFLICGPCLLCWDSAELFAHKQCEQL